MYAKGRIGVGRTDWYRSPLPPNRTGGSPASGSPVDGYPRRDGRMAATIASVRSGLSLRKQFLRIELLRTQVGSVRSHGRSGRSGAPARGRRVSTGSSLTALLGGLFCEIDGHGSIFLRPFAPPALPGFIATMDALTPARRLFVPALRHMNTSCTRAGLPASRVWPSEHSVPNHLARPRHRFDTQPFSVTDFRLTSVRVSPFPSRLTARPGRIGFVAYGLLVHLPLLSTTPRGVAVTFGYRPECACLKRTPTSLTKHARRRTGTGVLAGPQSITQLPRQNE
jgi:hypothetical protein